MRDRHASLSGDGVSLAVEADRDNEIAALCVSPVDAGFPGLPRAVSPSQLRSGAIRGFAWSLVPGQRSIQRGG